MSLNFVPQPWPLSQKGERGKPQGLLTFTSLILCLLLTSRHAKRADTTGIVSLSFFQIIADVPDCAIIGRVNRRLRVVLPTHNVLRRLTFDQNGFMKSQLP